MAKSKKKKRQPTTPLERLKQHPLWMWGLLCIFAAIFSNLANQYMIEANHMRGAEARGAQLGGAAAALLFVVIGVVLITMHFVRKK